MIWRWMQFSLLMLGLIASNIRVWLKMDGYTAFFISAISLIFFANLLIDTLAEQWGLVSTWNWKKGRGLNDE